MADEQYKYKALDQQGNDVSGIILAADEKRAFAQLSERGLSPYRVDASPESIGFNQFRQRTITRKDLARYVRQMATLLHANVSVLDALATLAQSGAHRLLAQRTQTIKRDLRAGKELSEALETHIPELPSYVCRLAELGQATGTLSKTLTDAADRLEYENDMRAEIRSALTYPTFLATVGTGIVMLMFIFVVPRFASLLGDNIDQAPWLSRNVIGFGVWAQANWPILALILVIVGGLFAAGARNDAVMNAVRSQLMRAPLIGPFLRQAEIGAWARTVGVALDNKARLVDALRLGEAGAQSLEFRRNLETVRRNVRAGRPLEDALFEAQRDVDPIVIDLIRTGRSSGTLGEMMMFAADIFEKDARERSKRLTALTEPIAILIIAGIVGMIVISIVMAMTSLYQFEV
ncbi:MAG: type II secretion system F family protein [Pseudomonadota bacterium]